MSDQFIVKTAVSPEDVAVAQGIRNRVFVHEQQIPAHLDADGLDDLAHHALGFFGNEVVATGRLTILEPGHGALGRIAVLPEYRGLGFGTEVVRKLEAHAEALGLRRLTIHPHTHLEEFYRDLGYRRISGGSAVAGHELINMRKLIGPSCGLADP